MFKKYYHKLITFLKLNSSYKKLSSLNKTLSEISITQLIKDLKRNELLKFGQSIFSQNDEDGIIEEIFNRINFDSKIFIEIGAGNGLENNTLNLLCNGWRGYWIETNPNFIKQINRNLINKIEYHKLKLIDCYLSKKNISILNQINLIEKKIDFLSVDIDSHDLEIIKFLNFKPRVICIEYNSHFGPNLKFETISDEKLKSLITNDNWGNSLKSINEYMIDIGYQIVACNITGINAFFVKNELLNNKFNKFENLKYYYMRPRYHLRSYFNKEIKSFESIVKLIKINQ
jgi:hypothetical protein